MFSVRVTRLDIGSGTPFLTITWKSKTELDPREGWMLQPCVRVRRGHWRCERPVAGPFTTKKSAQATKKYLESVDWRRTLSWDLSRIK